MPMPPRYPTVMFSTGPMFLTMQYMRYRGQHSDIFTLPGQLYSGSHGAFFRHYSGSSWHGADSRLIFWLYTNLALVLPLLAMAVLLTAIACWVMLVRDRKRKCY
jgi:mannosyltransferase OCH1-like enzyme